MAHGIPFRRGPGGAPFDPLDDAHIESSSSTLAWGGLTVVTGTVDGWETDDLVIDGHYLAMNTAQTAHRFEYRGPHGFNRTRIEPGGLWLNPARRPFTHRVGERCAFGAITLDPRRVAEVLGHDFELAIDYAVHDPQLTRLVQLLVCESRSGNPGGALFVETVATALMLHLDQHHVSAPQRPAVGGLAPAALRRLRAFVEAHLGESIGLDRLAAVCGLSTGHFTRAFRQSTGLSPGQFVMARRLERARDALTAHPPRSIAGIATDLGFSDQAHLTRQFKRRYGITPGAWRRARG